MYKTCRSFFSLDDNIKDEQIHANKHAYFIGNLLTRTTKRVLRRKINFTSNKQLRLERFTASRAGTSQQRSAEDFSLFFYVQLWMTVRPIRHAHTQTYTRRNDDTLRDIQLCASVFRRVLPEPNLLLITRFIENFSVQ